MKYRVCSRSLLTEAVSNGEPTNFGIAVAWKVAMDKKYPGVMEHWIEPVPNKGTVSRQVDKRYNNTI